MGLGHLHLLVGMDRAFRRLGAPQIAVPHVPFHEVVSMDTNKESFLEPIEIRPCVRGIQPKVWVKGRPGMLRFLGCTEEQKAQLSAPNYGLGAEKQKVLR